MKLKIKRDQADVKGLLGGHKGVRFSLYAKVDITDEERALIERYKVGDYILASYQFSRKGSEPVDINLRVNSLVNGYKTDMDSIYKLLELEEAIKNGCGNLKTLIQVMATFGGEETIEI